MSSYREDSIRFMRCNGLKALNENGINGGRLANPDPRAAERYSRLVED